MQVGANGIVVNEYGEVLLIRRDDTRTFAPPGGGVHAHELPTENIVHEVEEETGLKVLPVRLVGVYHFDWQKEGNLDFIFRCLPRGGQLTTSAESPQVGFFPTNRLPTPIAPVHRERLERSFAHRGGPPYWGVQKLDPASRLGKFLVRQILYPWRDWNRKRRGEPTHVYPPIWKLAAFTIIRDDAGAVLWVKRTDQDVWNLPGGGGHFNEAPWDTAVRETREETGLLVHLTDLTGVYVKPDTLQMILAFTAVPISGQLTTGPEAAEFAYFMSGSEPANSLPLHVERVADALGRDEGTIFRRQG
jgi:ADP-ribose pyrophosphatase YjhB (NUDIX family)